MLSEKFEKFIVAERRKEMSRFSVKKPYTVFVAVVICLILGVVSFTRMSTDLLTEFSLPYVVVVTTYPGASPDKIESTVTEPLESGVCHGKTFVQQVRANQEKRK